MFEDMEHCVGPRLFCFAPILEIIFTLHHKGSLKEHMTFFYSFAICFSAGNIADSSCELCSSYNSEISPFLQH